MRMEMTQVSSNRSHSREVLDQGQRVKSEENGKVGNRKSGENIEATGSERVQGLKNRLFMLSILNQSPAPLGLSSTVRNH